MQRGRRDDEGEERQTAAKKRGAHFSNSLLTNVWSKRVVDTLFHGVVPNTAIATGRSAGRAKRRDSDEPEWLELSRKMAYV
jgi:hypothetical protein